METKIDQSNKNKTSKKLNANQRKRVDMLRLEQGIGITTLVPQLKEDPSDIQKLFNIVPDQQPQMMLGKRKMDQAQVQLSEELQVENIAGNQLENSAEAEEKRSGHKRQKMNAPDLLVEFTKADDNQQKRAMLMNRLMPVQRELVELYDKACTKAGFRGPGLHQPIVNEEGQPQIGQLKIDLWEQRGLDVHDRGLVKAKHLMGGGIVDYKGKLSSLEQDTIDMDYVVGQIMMESFTSKLPGNNWYMSNIKQFSVVGDSLKREIALSHLLMRPCSAHYVLDISNYLPYLKYKSRRAVVVGKFLEPDLFWKGFLNHLNKKNESNKEREELIDACLRAQARVVSHRTFLQKSADGPIEQEIGVRIPEDPNKVKKIVYQGYLYRHGEVPANPLSSTCHEQTRKGATLSQNVVAINQALGCLSDLGLLRGALANTADLLFTLRLHRPDLFQEDELFVQLGAVAQNFPFALDLKVLDGALVAATGTYDDSDRNKVVDVDAALRIQLIMRGEFKPGEQDLTKCRNAVKQLFPVLNQMLIEARKGAADDGNNWKADKLSAIRKQFKKCRLILQVNIHSESGDKYAFVTNLQRRKQTKSEMQVLFRNITKSNAQVNQEKIAAVKKEIDRLSLGDSKASEYFDFILAKAQPSAQQLELTQFYRPWEEKLQLYVNKDLQLKVANDKIVDLQKEYVDQQASISDFNAKVAANIMNHLDPKTLGFNTKTHDGAQKFCDFWRSTHIHSWEIYVPLAEPVNNEKVATPTDQKSFKALINFILVKTGVVNELGTHLDLLDVKKKPGQIFRLLSRDLGLRDSYFKPEQTIERFKWQEADGPSQFHRFTEPARKVRDAGPKQHLFNEVSMKVFIRKYLRDLFHEKMLKKYQNSVNTDLFLRALKNRPQDATTSEQARSEQRTTGTSLIPQTIPALQKLQQVQSIGQVAMANEDGQKAQQQPNQAIQSKLLSLGVSTGTPAQLQNQQSTGSNEIDPPIQQLQGKNIRDLSNMSMTSVEKDDHVELNLNLSFNKKNIHPGTQHALSNDVTLSFIKGIVNATNQMLSNNQPQHQAAYQAFSGIHQAQDRLSPKLRYVFNRVTVHHARMYHLNAWENAGEYFAAVAETDLMNYELVASEDFLIRCMVANPPPSLMICKNCLLPVFPMVHLPLQTFEQYAIAVGVDTANLVPTVTIDLKSDTKLLQRLCDQTLCLIILWLKENECDYTSDTFGEVFLREPQVWLNVLHFLRIGVKLVEIFTVDILGISKSYLEEFKKKKNKKLSFKALLNLATFNQIGIGKFTEDSNIVPNRDLSQMRESFVRHLAESGIEFRDQPVLRQSTYLIMSGTSEDGVSDETMQIDTKTKVTSSGLQKKQNANLAKDVKPKKTPSDVGVKKTQQAWTKEKGFLSFRDDESSFQPVRPKRAQTHDRNPSGTMQSHQMKTRQRKDEEE